MNKVKLPSRICGQWIWQKDQRKPDTFLLFRKEFSWEFLDADAALWISANTAYQLFINERLVGFGPCGHYRAESCYIDQHNAGFYLESGRNVIAVRVYYDKSCSADQDDRPPGFWCQLAYGDEVVLATDDSWDVLPAPFYSGARPRIAQGEGRVENCQAANCPVKWNAADFKLNSLWKKPDSVIPLEKFPLRPELFPMPPPVISPESPEFSFSGQGVVSACPCWTGAQFKAASNLKKETFAAVGYVFSEEAAEYPAALYCDEPFKLFCNNQLISSRESAYGATAVLKLSAGWNRLLWLQEPEINSMGFMMIFPSVFDKNRLSVKQDMLDTAENGWCVAGPLRLTMQEATPSLRLDRLRVEAYRCSISMIPSIEELLKQSVLKKDTGSAEKETLKVGEFKVWKLPHQCYGFVKVTVSAGIGDIIDIVLSPRVNSAGFPENKKQRCLHTLICRGQETVFEQFVPDDCIYAGILARSCRGEVKVEAIEFRELSKEVFRKATFKCSDDLLNRFWTAGCRTIQRAVSQVPLADSRISQDMFLFDAYADALNTAVAFGDSGYLAARLRQFWDLQLENGNIPAMTHSDRRQFQLQHILFLPQWIMHNYNFSGSLVELERALPVLDFVRDFFETMLDPELGLLCFPDDWHKKDARLSPIDFSEGKIASCLSSLFCRFLLSASDVYRVAGNKSGELTHCIRLAEKTAANIRKYCKDPESGLFVKWADKDKKSGEFDFFSNFCAMYGGVMAPEDFETFFFSFFNYDPPFEKKADMTPYAAFLFSEMMFACGQRHWIFRYMVDYWKHRLAPDDSGWLVPGTDSLRKTVFQNGAVISPNVFLIKEVLGIRRGENGQQILFFHPGADFVKSAEGSVPMSNGRLLVKWQKTDDGGLDVTLDSNVPVTIMPELGKENLRKTAFELSELVTLLQPPEDFEDDILL